MKKLKDYFKKSKDSVDYQNQSQFLDAIRLAYNNAYKFGASIDGDKDKLFIPTAGLLSGDYIYMYHNPTEQKTYFMSVNTEWFQQNIGSWIQSGKKKMSVIDKAEKEEESCDEDKKCTCK